MNYSFTEGLNEEDRETVLLSLGVPELLHEVKTSNEEDIHNLLKNYKVLMNYQILKQIFERKYDEFMTARNAILRSNLSQRNKITQLIMLNADKYRELAEINSEIKVFKRF